MYLVLDLTGNISNVVCNVFEKQFCRSFLLLSFFYLNGLSTTG